MPERAALFQPLGEISGLEREIIVNLTAPLLLLRRILPISSGKIVAISSTFAP